MLPSVTVACGNEACRYAGRERRVHLRTAAPGVVEVPRLACAGCGFDMPTVTPWPPVTESEEDMTPKITVHGGASNAGAEPEPVNETDEAAGEDVSTEDSSPASGTSAEQDYEDWTVDQLKEELAKRDLPRSGKRDDLVQRLRDDDATAETE